MATNTAGGADRLTMRLTVARNGQAYGPVEQTWTIAEARLSGIIYYNSYGTQLAHNYTGAVGGNGQFGGAVLSIRGGDPGPALAAGADGGAAQCRVCHSVSADGSRMVAQHGDNSAISSAYDLTPAGITEIPLAVGAEFPGLSPDGAMMLTPAAALRPLPDDAAPLPASGLTAVATSIGTPAFSPDGKQVVFNPMAGGSTVNPRQKLVVMDFDPATLAFSNPVEIVDYTGQPAETRPGWPAFFPDGNSVVFHTQIAAGADGNNLGDLRTRKGARAEIAWAPVTGGGPVTPLDQLNGRDAAGASYLPKLGAPISMTCTGDSVQVGSIDADHGDDVHLNYEPTVSPIASGGYAWVVFTSRRLYGSVAEIPPFCSDPRGVNLFQNITPKKLWVAAIDINGQPGTDASHPAFYLPGQELLAGNSRGFWVQDQCKPDGAACEAGDECCNGHCQPDDTGQLVCQYIPPGGDCSGPQESCATSADCCDPENLCINGFCTVTPPE
ncbi:MAG: PD40 domain-containing protein [Polyangiaceae bacterium]|nr:PD40 domain-containing protein [Polyangiaceae bacterium]